MKNKKWLYAGLIIAAIFLLGFFRDFIFVNLNGQMYFAFHGRENTYLDDSLQFLKKLSYMQLYLSKYFLTLIFFLAFMALSLAALKILFQDYKYLKTVFISFITVFCTALLILLLGMLVGKSNEAYTLSRFMMGWVQSPLALFIFIPAYSLFQKK